MIYDEIPKTDRLLAEKVLGWTRETPKGRISNKQWYNRNGRHMGFFSQFRFSKSLDDCKYLLDAIEERFGSFILTKDYKGPYRFKIISWNNGGYDVIAEEVDDTKAGVIIKAALEAWNIKEAAE
ncbi:hypothetical protein RY280_23465 [Bacillus paralicheniformis]|uniref:hypothetical protein n=1 Tax=Bacillus paralicheniformis TaxID=1648923 RepID=UPI00203DE588|nr:hypothetical protein [Bacillus paralicheniformis]MCM3425601.1 hypothetical protein [Bacillus paralicheniformis]